MSYFFEKISEAIRGAPAELGPIALEQVERAFAEFRTALESRGLDLETYDGIKHLYLEVAYPLEKLRTYFRRENPVDPEAAHIFAWFVQCKLKELIEMAIEIDKEYAR